MNEGADLRDLVEERGRRYMMMIEALDRLTMQRFEDQEKSVVAAMASAERAVLKAELAANERFAAVNEFRAQLSDQSSTFLPRGEYAVQHSALNDKVDALERALVARLESLSLTRATGEGKSAYAEQLWGRIVAAAAVGGLVVAIVLHFLK